jgi:hypothetical protein
VFVDRGCRAGRVRARLRIGLGVNAHGAGPRLCRHSGAMAQSARRGCAER